jgi:hypothetical protein
MGRLLLARAGGNERSARILGVNDGKSKYY